MKKYLISNVVYGDLYSRIFTQYHLRSLLDETNLPAIAPHYEIEYRVYTDEETRAKLEAHPNVKKLSKLAKVDLATFNWPSGADRFAKRYRILTDATRDTIDYALQNGFNYVTSWVADLVVARGFMEIMKRVETGHDAVFVLPLRSAFESSAGYHDQLNRALEPMELFKVAFTHLHPLWLACEYKAHRFTKLPFTLLWSKPHGIMARSFSVTPIIFEPKPEMLTGRCMIDGDIPQHFKNPYWCENWTDAPVIGLEPLFCYYPTFHNTTSSKSTLRRWARTALHPSQIPLMKKRLYYPNKETVRMDTITRIKSDAVVRFITA